MSIHPSELQNSLDDEDSDITNRRKAAIGVVCRCGLALKYVEEEWRLDKEVVTAAISNDGRALVYACQSIKDDEDIVALAVRNRWAALKHASVRLRDNAQLVTVAVTNSGAALQYASERLRGDADMVTLAVATWGLALEHASEHLKNDIAIVTKAIATDTRAFSHASHELQKNEAIAAAAGRRDIICQAVIERVTIDGCALRKEQDEWKDNKQVLLSAVKNNGLALKYASKNLKNDHDAVMAAITNDNSSLKYASKNLRNSIHIIKPAVSRDGRALEYASQHLKNDQDIVHTAVTQYGDSLRYASIELKDNIDIVTVAVKQDAHSLRYASARLREDEQLFRHYAIARVSLKGTEIKTFEEKWKNDRDVVSTAVKNDWTTLKYASQELKADKTFIADMVTREGSALQYATDQLRSDKDIVLLAVKTRPEALKFALGGLNEDPECLIAAGLWDASYSATNITNTQQDTPATKNIVLSVKLDISADDDSIHTTAEHSATFITKLNNHPFFKNYVLFQPDSYVDSCDPDWTNIPSTCLATYSTCENTDEPETGIGQGEEDICCWRCQVHHSLEQGRDTNGFMVQVVEVDESTEEHVLENNQTIELEMAESVGIKIFRVYQDIYFGDVSPFDDYHIARLVERVKSWNHKHCVDMKESEIKLMKHYSI